MREVGSLLLFFPTFKLSSYFCCYFVFGRTTCNSPLLVVDGSGQGACPFFYFSLGEMPQDPSQLIRRITNPQPGSPAKYGKLGACFGDG